MKVIKLLQKSAKDKMVKTAAGLLSTNPEKNVDRLFTLIEKTIAKDEDNLKRLKVVEDEYYNNPSTHEFVQNLFKTTDKNCMQKFFTNFFANAVWYGMPKREKLFKEDEIKTPFVILIS
ncbi:radical SAM protein, partial [Clostridium sporogenes]